MDFRELIDLWPAKAILAKEIGVSDRGMHYMYSSNNIHHSRWDAVIMSAEKWGIKGINLKKLAKIKAASIIANREKRDGSR